MTPETLNLIRSNLGAYYLAANPDYMWVSYQQDYIVPALHRLSDHKIEALMLLMPPRHAKSELGSIHYIPWLYGRYPSRNNMLLSYSDKFAKRFGRRIVNLMEEELYKQVFPGTRLSPFARSGSYALTTEGGEFFSAGFGGTITGSGVDGVMILDDPVKSMEEARSATMMESRMEDYRSSAKTRLENASRLLNATRWCRGDFVDRVLDEEGTLEEGGVWTVLKFPAEAGEDDPLDRPVGQFLWAERFGERWYQEHKKATRTWSALYQQAPQSAKGKFFKREWLNFYPKPIKPGKFPAYMLTDPAMGRSSSSDRTAIGVFVATPEKRILLVDAALGRFDPEERALECLRLLKKWKPRRWLYEEIALNSDTWALTQRAKAANIHIYPIPVGRKGKWHMLSKESRIESLIPDFREGRIWLPNHEDDPANGLKAIPFPTLCDDGVEPISIIDYFLNEEYGDYEGEDSTAHDDFLDMMTFLHHPECGLTFPSGPAEEFATMNNRTYRRPTSWESVM